MHIQGINKLHINLNLKGMLSMPGFRLVFVLFALIASLPISYAKESSTNEFTATENGSIVITTVEGNSAIIHAVSIAATEGSSVILLPGTHIKAGDELTVSIVSREYYDGLAEQAAEEEQRQVVASILERQDASVKPMEAALILRLPGTNGRRPQVQLQLNLHAALPTRDQNTTNFGIVLNRLQTYQSGDCIIPQTTFNNPNLPSQSWGNRGEMIAVMLT